MSDKKAWAVDGSDADEQMTRVCIHCREHGHLQVALATIDALREIMRRNGLLDTLTTGRRDAAPSRHTCGTRHDPAYSQCPKEE